MVSMFERTYGTSTVQEKPRNRRSLRIKSRVETQTVLAACINVRSQQHKLASRAILICRGIMSKADGNPKIFSCDLVSEAKRHVHFLRRIHACGSSLGRPSEQSFHRYSELWLPLVAAHFRRRTEGGVRTLDVKLLTVTSAGTDFLLIPPPDVAWLWHCHRLAPYRYIEHVQQRFSLEERQILEADAPFSLQTDPSEAKHHSLFASWDEGIRDGVKCYHSQRDAEETRKLWGEMYPDDPFFLNSQKETTGTNMTEARNGCSGMLSGFNVLDSAERQSTFLWHFSGKQYSDEAFLRQGLQNYYKFLLLKSLKAAQQLILVPTIHAD